MNKSTKILLISPFFSPNVGGVETILDEFVKQLADEKVFVDVFTLKPVTVKIKSLDNEIKHNKFIKILRFNFFSSNLYHSSEKSILLNFLYIFPIFFLKCFIKFLKNYKEYDSISAHGFHSLLISGFLNLILKKKINFFVYSNYDNFKESFIKKNILKILLKIPDKIFCISESNEIIIKDISNKNNIFRFVSPVSDQLYLDKNIKKYEKPTVLFVGRFIEKKGIKLLLSAAKHYNNINFIFVGSGPLDDLINDSQLKNIKNLGVLKGIALRDIYNKCHVTALVSIYDEALGVVFQESLICGTPVLVNKNIIASKYISEDVGFRVDLTNMQSFLSFFPYLEKNFNKFTLMSTNCAKFAESKFRDMDVLKLI